MCFYGFIEEEKKYMEELIVENGLFYFLILNYLIFKIDFLKCSLVIKYMYIVIFFLMNIYLYKEGKDINYKKKMKWY